MTKVRAHQLVRVAKLEDGGSKGPVGQGWLAAAAHGTGEQEDPT
jgi:hypothetical protein